MINVNKVWFYSTAMAVVIAGVYFSLPSEEQQAKMQAAAAKKKAERAAKRQQSAAQPPAQHGRSSFQAASAGCGR
ncbi:MFS transporter [uncultured Kingella sp.]|uniref:MFS transporter n=1 Tax=uncultured Kingella sp. TaxID=159270 RepID=UPI00259751D1|nr:MFS transporter [uncultured Kingella sp.]